MIFAVVTLLNEIDRNQIIKQVPDLIEDLASQELSKFLHISWMVSENIKVPEVEKCLNHLASLSHPLKIFSGGLGIFTGENPAIVLNFARNEQINNLHTQIWQSCLQKMGNIKPYSHPNQWMPHVTLLHDQNDFESPLVFIKTYMHIALNLQVCIDNLAILYRDNGNAGMISQFVFKKDKNETNTSKIPRSVS